MKLILLSFLFLLSTFQLIAQFDFDGLLRKDYIDSANFKNRGIYVTYSPVCIGSSINTDNKDRFSSISSRVAIHWMTKRYQKFQLFASFGGAYNSNSYRVKTFETGLMIGKLWKGKRRGFFELNAGVAYFTRKENGIYMLYTPDSDDWHRVNEVHTVGIPFEAMAYTLKLPVGIGIGLVGNLNVNQPYFGFLLRVRFGNPALKKHSTLNWFR